MKWEVQVFQAEETVLEGSGSKITKEGHSKIHSGLLTKFSVAEQRWRSADQRMRCHPGNSYLTPTPTPPAGIFIQCYSGSQHRSTQVQKFYDRANSTYTEPIYKNLSSMSKKNINLSIFNKNTLLPNSLHKEMTNRRLSGEPKTVTKNQQFCAVDYKATTADTLNDPNLIRGSKYRFHTFSKCLDAKSKTDPKIHLSNNFHISCPIKKYLPEKV